MNQNHEKLDHAVQQWLEKQDRQHYQNIIDALAELIAQNENVLINALELYDADHKVDPMGIIGADGLFYIIIFATKQRSSEGENSNPKLAKINDLIKAAFINKKCGGICINYHPGHKAPLVSKKVLVHLWDESLNEQKK